MSSKASDTLAENLAVVAAQGGTSAVYSDAAIITASVPITTAGVQIIASNLSRKGMMIYNNSANSIYIRYDTTVTGATCSDIIPTYTAWKMPSPCYRGPIAACRNAGSGNAIITEMI